MLTQAALEHARLEGALLMARTLAHRVNNALALVVGYGELLGQHPAVRADPRLIKYAQAARDGGLQAAAELSRLQRIVRLVEDTSMALPFPILDLERSTAPDLPDGTAAPTTLAEAADQDQAE